MDWVMIASALAGAALVVGNVMAEEAAKIGARTLADQFAERFLRSYIAQQHEAELRGALEETEAAFRAVPGITALQINHVLGGVNRLVKDAGLQKQTLETMLLLDTDEPALISDDLLRAFGLATELRPALATFLFTFRIHFAQIKAYTPLMDFAGEQQTRQILRGILNLETRAIGQHARIIMLLEAWMRAQDIPTDSDESKALARYRQHIEAKHSQLSFLFVQPRTREATQTAELEAVFVPLQVHDPEQQERTRRAMERRIPRGELTSAEREGLKPQTINDLLPRYPCLLLMGKPGCGKTTLLRHLALAFARNEHEAKLGWSRAPLLPIFVPLRNFGQFLSAGAREYTTPGPLSVVAFIEDHFTQYLLNLPTHFFRDRLARGGCLVLLDALDEVSDPALRARVAQHITAFLKHYSPRGNHFVLSSRPDGYKEVKQFLALPTLCEVQLLQPAGRAELIRNLCHVLERDPRQADLDAAKLLQEIPRKDKVEELSRTPLFCTVIVLVSKYRHTTLPERRVDILQEIVRLLLGFWDTQREDVAEADALAKEDGTGRVFRDVDHAVEAKERALIHLAYWMQNQGLVDTPEKDAAQELARFFIAREDAKQPGGPGWTDRTDASQWARGFLAVAHHRSGLFVEGAPNVYNFSHKSFLEYLAASALLDELDTDLCRLVLQHAPDSAWEEVILLALAHQKSGDPRRKMLIEALMNGGHLLMAGKCAVDMGDRLAAPLRQDLITKSKTLMQSARDKPTTRAAAGETLDALGWLPDDLNAFVHIPEGETIFNTKRVRVPEFWIGKYPVTCAQYRRFIDADGYATERYWHNQRGVDENGREKNLRDEAWEWLKEQGGAERRPWQWDNPRFHRAGYPVIGVTWYEASAYCCWLTEKLQQEDKETGKQGENSSFTRSVPPSSFVCLPTEQEWVRAAGGDANARYAWDAPGKSTVKLPDAQRQEIVLARANVAGSEIGGTTPVAMYPDGKRVTENSGEIWDLGGNVWEWTSSLAEGYPGAYLRGGAYQTEGENAGVRARYDHYLVSDNSNLGLRVVVASRIFPRS